MDIKIINNIYIKTDSHDDNINNNLSIMLSNNRLILFSPLCYKIQMVMWHLCALSEFNKYDYYIIYYTLGVTLSPFTTAQPRPFPL